MAKDFGSILCDSCFLVSLDFLWKVPNFVGHNFWFWLLLILYSRSMLQYLLCTLWWSTLSHFLALYDLVIITPMVTADTYFLLVILTCMILFLEFKLEQPLYHLIREDFIMLTIDFLLSPCVSFWIFLISYLIDIITLFDNTLGWNQVLNNNFLP